MTHADEGSSANPAFRFFRYLLSRRLTVIFFESPGIIALSLDLNLGNLPKVDKFTCSFISSECSKIFLTSFLKTGEWKALNSELKSQ